MAFSPLFRLNVKAIILSLLVMSLLYLGIFLYLDVITIPYLSPVAVAVGDSLSPFTPLIDPLFAYINLKQWLHPAATTYRAAAKGSRYRAIVLAQSIGSFMTVFCISIKFSWVMQILYGLKSEGMCVGPCWKLWMEFVLAAMVVFAVIMGRDLDGGLYGRYIDRQVLKMKQADAEKASVLYEESADI
jgi:hypothetical protein